MANVEDAEMEVNEEEARYLLVPPPSVVNFSWIH